MLPGSALIAGNRQRRRGFISPADARESPLASPTAWQGKRQTKRQRAPSLCSCPVLCYFVFCNNFGEKIAEKYIAVVLAIRAACADVSSTALINKGKGGGGPHFAEDMRSVRKRWTVCTISLLLIFYKTKEITRTEERREAPLAG